MEVTGVSDDEHISHREINQPTEIDPNKKKKKTKSVPVRQKTTMGKNVFHNHKPDECKSEKKSVDSMKTDESFRDADNVVPKL